MHAVPINPSSTRPARRGTFLEGTALTFLKPRFRKVLRPFVGRLARIGVTANQVTLLSLAGSLFVGGWIAAHADQPVVFVLLPAWLVARMCCATIDGTLAIDFGQKSRLGGALNEVGDIVSDAALLIPLACNPAFAPGWVATVMALTALTEVAGLLGLRLGGSRRLDGPAGKADRSLALGALGGWIAMGAPLPGADVLLGTFSLLLLITIANRLRAAVAQGETAVVGAP